MRTLAAGLVLLCTAAAASADPVIDVAVETRVEVRVDAAEPSPPPPPPPSPPPPGPPRSALRRGHWEAGLAMTIPLGAADLGAHAVAGRQLGAFRLAAEYSLTPTSCGQISRIGASARYRPSTVFDLVASGFYAEAGLGRQDRRWTDGAMPEVRRDVAVGFGVEMLGGGAGLVGFDMGARFTMAEGATDAHPSELTATIVFGFLVGA